MCKSERNVTSLCACNELHMMYTAGELKQSWQKSHHPVQKRQPCNLVVSMYEVTEQRISCVLEHGSEMCVHIRVCLHMYCLSVVYLCKGVLVHACVCVCIHMYVSLLRPQQETHLPARGTIRGTVRRWQDYSEAVASRLHSATRKVCVSVWERDT